MLFSRLDAINPNPSVTKEGADYISNARDEKKETENDFQ